MMMKPMGRTAQGEALPKFSRTGLPDTVRHGTIFPVVTLSKWRRGWRIKHPQAVTAKNNQHLFPKLRPLCRRSIQFRGMGREPKKTPRLRLCSLRRCFAATRSAFASYCKGQIPMIFTFLIASSACRLADLRRIRTITAVADTEAQARTALAGLPLVFMSRTPTGRAQA